MDYESDQVTERAEQEEGLWHDLAEHVQPVPLVTSRSFGNN